MDGSKKDIEIKRKFYERFLSEMIKKQEILDNLEPTFDSADLTNKEYQLADDALYEARNVFYRAWAKAHPNGFTAIRSHASWQEVHRHTMTDEQRYGEFRKMSIDNIEKLIDYKPFT